MITFVCLNAQNYCGQGAEYVNILRDMVYRNSPQNGWRFVCVTDDPTDLSPDIQVMPLPSDLEEWWGKLYLFKKDLFPAGERIVFFDLDTLVAGPLDEMMKYKGPFAMLQDFYRTDGNSGVMMWEAGTLDHIWDKWVEQGRPKFDRGDQQWINLCEPAVFLQDLFPSRFASYKLNCLSGLPNKTAVVCFHGTPKPHQVNGWVSDIWKIDGYTGSDIEVINNVNSTVLKNNIHTNSQRDLAWLKLEEREDKDVLIIGGAPSLKDNIEEIRSKDTYIIALNGAAKYLREQDIFVNATIVVDARSLNLPFVGYANEYFLASQCDPSLFDAVNNATLFHIDIPDIGSFVPGDRPIQAIGGGITVGLIAMSLAYVKGFRNIHLYGYDSSYADNTHHAYGQSQNDGEPIIEAHVNGRTFTTSPWMVTQTQQFQSLAKQLIGLGCAVTVHGTGLLPFVAWQMAQTSQRVLTQKEH